MSLLHMLKHMLARKWPDERSGKEKKDKEKSQFVQPAKPKQIKIHKKMSQFFVLFFKE